MSPGGMPARRIAAANLTLKMALVVPDGEGRA